MVYSKKRTSRKYGVRSKKRAVKRTSYSKKGKSSYGKRRSVKGRRSKTVGKKRLLPSLSHTEVNRNMVYPRTHMRQVSELVVSNSTFYAKAYLVPTALNAFGTLVFPMNVLSGPGYYNQDPPITQNTVALVATNTMPNFMGSTAQTSRYGQALVTYSKISINIKVKQGLFTRTGTGADAFYDSNLSNRMYFCLVPYNSSWTSARYPALQLMQWAQIIRQPGARRMTLSGIHGKDQGTLTAATSIGRIDGTPGWESDSDYRCYSSTLTPGTWDSPVRRPIWMLYAYYPYGNFSTASPICEFDIKLAQNVSYFLPNSATLYTAVEPTEMKSYVVDGSSTESTPMVEETEFKDDDDPTLIDMADFRVSTPQHPSTSVLPLTPALLSRAPSVRSAPIPVPVRVPAKK